MSFYILCLWKFFHFSFIQKCSSFFAHFVPSTFHFSYSFSGMYNTHRYPLLMMIFFAIFWNHFLKPFYGWLHIVSLLYCIFHLNVIRLCQNEKYMLKYSSKMHKHMWNVWNCGNDGKKNPFLLLALCGQTNKTQTILKWFYFQFFPPVALKKHSINSIQ